MIPNDCAITIDSRTSDADLPILPGAAMRNGIDRLKRIADDVRRLYRVDHVLPLGDLDLLAQRHGARPHVVDAVVSAMTVFSATPGARTLRPEYQPLESYPSELADLAD